jgi:hypothetical protein
VQGLDLWGIELSDKPGVEEAEPKFKYIAVRARLDTQLRPTW